MALALLLGSLLKLSQLDWGELGLCVARCVVIDATTHLPASIDVADVLSALWTELLFSATVAGVVRLADAIKGTSTARL